MDKALPIQQPENLSFIPRTLQKDGRRPTPHCVYCGMHSYTNTHI